MTERQLSSEHQLTLLQEAALSSLCERYEVEYNPDHYRPVFDLPPDWVAGWVVGIAQQDLTLHPAQAGGFLVRPGGAPLGLATPGMEAISPQAFARWPEPVPACPAVRWYSLLMSQPTGEVGKCFGVAAQLLSSQGSAGVYLTTRGPVKGDAIPPLLESGGFLAPVL